jgi:NAD(P)-dependent dehydrogenase (short-subunit alcohol dehydrogenase family)
MEASSEVKTMATLEGKVAFVTGGGSGIGRAAAVRLARDGADVAVSDIDLEGAQGTAELVREAGRKAHVQQANAASERQIREAVEGAVQALGRIDVSVANAGIARAGSLLDMSVKDWQDQLDVNLTGVFLTAQASARQMVRQGEGGRIICMASLAAEITGPMSWGYSATKAGVRMLVRGWGQELGAHGITVNAIGPGIIETPLARMLAGREGGAIRQAVDRVTPLGRVGQPEDIAGLVAFLAGPDAAFMTGSYLIMDGGFRDAPKPFGLDMDPSDPRVLEAMELVAEEGQRRLKLQPLIDER